MDQAACVGGLLLLALPHCSQTARDLWALTALLLEASSLPGITGSWPIGEEDPVRWLFRNLGFL